MAGHRTTGKITVDGMTCSHCEQRIEAAVKALDGVIKVNASAPLSEVTVVYDSDRVSFEAIAGAIRGTGYKLRGDVGSVSPATAGATPPASGLICDASPPREAAARGASARSAPVYRFLGLIAVIVALYLVLRYTVGFTFLPGGEPVHGLWAPFCRRSPDVPALHRHVRRDRAFPGHREQG